eukprot:1178628-Prorocentrum_minimum.AAC.3
MFALDKQCRPAMVSASPTLDDLIYLCKDLKEGYSEDWGPKRRKYAARCVATMLLRDGHMREDFVKKRETKGEREEPRQKGGVKKAKNERRARAESEERKRRAIWGKCQNCLNSAAVLPSH